MNHFTVNLKQTQHYKSTILQLKKKKISHSFEQAITRKHAKLFSAKLNKCACIPNTILMAQTHKETHSPSQHSMFNGYTEAMEKGTISALYLVKEKLGRKWRERRREP